MDIYNFFNCLINHLILTSGIVFKVLEIAASRSTTAQIRLQDYRCLPTNKFNCKITDVCRTKDQQLDLLARGPCRSGSSRFYSVMITVLRK